MKQLFGLSMLACMLNFGLNTALYAHGNETHAEAMEYDPVSNEFGAYDPALKPDRTITIDMQDTMRFTPSSIEVAAGEVIKFVVSNSGKLQHEFVLGTTDSLEEHAEMMKKFPNMEHEEPYMAHVDPGKTMEIVWQFSEGGSFEYGCLLPGHFEAGMRGSVAVN